MGLRQTKGAAPVWRWLATSAIPLDTGPLVAALSRADRYHVWATELLGRLRPPLLTCEPALSEAVYLLRSAPDGARAVAELLSRGVLKIALRLEDAMPRAATLIGKHGPLRMNLADACILVLAERHAAPAKAEDRELRVRPGLS